MSLKILLVDDHRLMLKGLRLTLEQVYTQGLTVSEAVTASSAWEKAQAFKPDLILMDIHLPDGDGIELSGRILKEFPKTKIIILSAESHLSLINKALQFGVAGYLMQENASEELVIAINAVLAGKNYLCSEANTIVLDDYKKRLKGTPLQPALSSRELEVLRLIAEGLRMKEIAGRLQVGVKTAETYRRRLLKKLGCAGTAELVRYALREGIISAY